MTDEFKDVYVPCFSVKIEGILWSAVKDVPMAGPGEVIDISQYCSSFSFSDSEDDLDELEVTLANPNSMFTDHKLFQEGNLIHFKYGYVNNMSPLHEGIIDRFSYGFGPSGLTITIFAHDKAVLLTRKVRQETYVDMTYTAIARQIASDHGLGAVIEDHPMKLAQTNQPGWDDMQLLKKLASQLPKYVVYVQDGDLHFHPENTLGTPSVLLTYFLDNTGMLVSFDGDSDSQGTRHGASVKKVGHDLKENAPVTKTADDENAKVKIEQTKLTDGKTTFSINAGGGNSKYTGKVVPTAAGSSVSNSGDTQTEDEAVSEKVDLAENEVEFSATTIGIPNLCAKSVVTIAGAVGRKFRDNYYVKSVSHSIDGGGYTCELSLVRYGVGDVDSSTAADMEGSPNVKVAGSEKCSPPAEAQYKVGA